MPGPRWVSTRRDPQASDMPPLGDSTCLQVVRCETPVAIAAYTPTTDILQNRSESIQGCVASTTGVYRPRHPDALVRVWSTPCPADWVVLIVIGHEGLKSRRARHLLRDAGLFVVGPDGAAGVGGSVDSCPETVVIADRGPRLITLRSAPCPSRARAHVPSSKHLRSWPLIGRHRAKNGSRCKRWM